MKIKKLMHQLSTSETMKMRASNKLFEEIVLTLNQKLGKSNSSVDTLKVLHKVMKVYEESKTITNVKVENMNFIHRGIFISYSLNTSMTDKRQYFSIYLHEKRALLLKGSFDEL